MSVKLNNPIKHSLDFEDTDLEPRIKRNRTEPIRLGALPVEMVQQIVKSSGVGGLCKVNKSINNDCDLFYDRQIRKWEGLKGKIPSNLMISIEKEVGFTKDNCKKKYLIQNCYYKLFKILNEHAKKVPEFVLKDNVNLYSLDNFLHMSSEIANFDLQASWKERIHQECVNDENHHLQGIPAMDASAELIRSWLKENGNEIILPDLNLSSLGLTFMPNEIKFLNSLERLFLNDNQIVCLSEFEVGAFPILEELILDDNEIVYLPRFQDGILPSLEELYLNNNKIISFPTFEAGGLENLFKLELSSNQIFSIPDFEVGALSRLEVLTLTGNQIKSLPIFKEGDLPSLDKLHLDCNQIDFFPMFEVGSLPRLIKLDLHSNQIIYIPEFEKGVLPGLYNLDLSNNKIGFMFGFEALPNLEKINLDGNQFHWDLVEL